MSFLLSHFTPAPSHRSIQKLPTSTLNCKAFQKHYKSFQNQKYYHFRGIFRKEDFYRGRRTIVSRNYSSGTVCTVYCLTCPTACLKVKKDVEQILVISKNKLKVHRNKKTEENRTERIAFPLCNSCFWNKPSSDWYNSCIYDFFLRSGFANVKRLHRIMMLCEIF